MSNNQQTELSSTQKALEELRERLRQNAQIMQSSAKKADSTSLMSGVIQAVGTFEKS